MKNFALRVALAFLFTVSSSFAVVPTLFFTDLQSGPAIGGEAGAGAFVTVYGNFFGATPTVQIAGVNAPIKAQAPWLWYQKITFQIPASVANGNTNITVTNVDGVSNIMPFTVRPGTIRFVGAQSGDQASVVACKNAMAPGDICYIRDGRSQTGQEGLNATVILNATAPITNPRAIVMYPGASATIGSAATQRAFHWCDGESACNGGSGGWVISAGGGNMVCTGQNCTDSNIGALADAAIGFRFVGLQAKCLNEIGQTACLTFNISQNLYFLGVECGSSPNSSTEDHHQYHCFYATTDACCFTVAYSSLHGDYASSQATGWWGIQAHSSPESSIAGSGKDEYDIHIFSNKITLTRGGGINLASVDPTKVGPQGGGVEVVNNIVYNTGATGPGGSTIGCMQIDSFDGSTGTVRVANNTFYNCHIAGAPANYDEGMIQFGDNSGGSIKSSVYNNIFYNVQPGGCQSGTSVSNNGGARTVGTNDLWFGCSDVPSGQVSPLRVDPQFVSLSGADFHLAATSPALHAGTATGAPVYDIEGNLRGSSPSIGAYDVPGAVVPPPPGQTVSKDYQLTVTPAVSIATTALPDATVGVAYSFSLLTAGGNGPKTWTVTGLPAGLTASTAGIISGTPTAQCSTNPCSVLISVFDADGPPPVSVTLPLNVNVVVVNPLAIATTSPLPGGKVGRPYVGVTFAATGGTAPYTWGVAAGSTLPPGLALSASGVLSGTPTAVCAQSQCAFTIQVTDSSGIVAFESFPNNPDSAMGDRVAKLEHTTLLGLN